MRSFPSRIGITILFLLFTCFAAAAATPGIAIAGPTAPIQVSRTQLSSASFTITPLNGFKGAIQFNCALASEPANAMDVPICIAGPVDGRTVTITGAKPVKSGVIIVGPQATPPPRAQAESGTTWMAYGGTAFACVLLFGFPKRPRHWRFLLSLLFAIVAFSCVGCGSSGSYTFNLTGVNTATMQTMATTSFTVVVH